MTILLIFGLLALVPPLAYLGLVSALKLQLPTLRNKRICLLIAHPDDEAMFFAPTLLALTDPTAGNHVRILCLSSGDAEGLGETRKKELRKSAHFLGIKQEEDVIVLDDKIKFPDSMSTAWSRDDIAALLSSTFGEQQPALDVLLTFDAEGVSNHMNHRSLYHGACHWLAQLHRDVGSTTAVARGDRAKPAVNMYTLTSVSLLRKYTMFWDLVPTLLMGRNPTPKQSSAMSHPSLVFASSLGAEGWGAAWRAMTQAHRSQMLWFRYGWIVMSRYMVVNDLRLVSMADARTVEPLVAGSDRRVA